MAKGDKASSAPEGSGEVFGLEYADLSIKDFGKSISGRGRGSGDCLGDLPPGPGVGTNRLRSDCGYRLYAYAGMSPHQIRQKRLAYRRRGFTPLFLTREVPWFEGSGDDVRARNDVFFAECEARWHEHGRPTSPEIPLSEIWVAMPEVYEKHKERRAAFRRGELGPRSAAYKKHLDAYEAALVPNTAIRRRAVEDRDRLAQLEAENRRLREQIHR